MPLANGTRLGSYEILAPIGAGGMGEVYRARDARLGRDVAIKVLPETFARDAGRLARFEREAKVLAALNHPNIASIYGLEDSGNTHALVMELAEGPTLADRIASGPIQMEETLRIARQICDALEYAHERGIVHRDLKPANVKVARDDTAKILDFGLAKAIAEENPEVHLANSPTLSRLATQAGFILGTAAYMSPEQAKGKTVDRRADIWAFGCLLYEMLTGEAPFHGETVTDTLAAVIRADPDWPRLPAETPTSVRVLLKRCLQKDSKQRLRDIGDARISIDEVLSGEARAVADASRQNSISWKVWLASGLAGLLLLSTLWLAWARFREVPPTPSETARLEMPIHEDVTPAANGAFAISPDGRQFAFLAAGSDNVERIWVRSLDSLAARPLPGTESRDVMPPFFWSPDSRFIAFAHADKLKKIAVAGGAAQTLCDTGAGPGPVWGVSWNRDGVIIFGQSRGGLLRVSSQGGTASPLTTVDLSREELRHAYPYFLPDGRHFIYTRVSNSSEKTGAYVGSLDAKPEEQNSKLLLATQSAPAFVPSVAGAGYLLFVRDGALVAQPFDPGRLALTGEPVQLVDRVGTFLERGLFSASPNGILVYQSAEIGSSEVKWFDRQGRTLGAPIKEEGTVVSVALSPDAQRVALSKLDPNPAIWLRDFSRGTTSRFSFGSSITAGAVWSPDGESLIFRSLREGSFNLYLKPANGAKDEKLLFKSPETKFADSWSRDGRFFLFGADDPTTKGDLWVLPVRDGGKPFPFLRTEFAEYGGQFSPDGRWVAYYSDESGRDEIYVRPFLLDPSGASASAGGKWLISTGGGIHPRWRSDGKELYYISGERKLMAVDVATDSAFHAGIPKVLFQAPPAVVGARVLPQWDLAPDGKRFLFITPAEHATQAVFNVVVNWQSALKK